MLSVSCVFNCCCCCRRFEPGHLVTGVNNWLACMTADAVIKAACNVDMDNIARRARGEAFFCYWCVRCYKWHIHATAAHLLAVLLGI
jgi:hypothetical protein